MSLPLHDKVALVTGAGKNIGRGIALALARDGAAIVVNGRADRAAVDQVVRETEAAGGRAMAAMGDVSDPAVPPRLASEAAARFGGVDILVSNAGLRRQTSFLDMPFDEWREIMSVALDGAFLLGKAIVPQMVARGGGAFVALSGISTHVGTPNLPPRRTRSPATRSRPAPSTRRAARRQDRVPWRTDRSRSNVSARSTKSPPWCGCWSDRKAPSSPARRST